MVVLALQGFNLVGRKGSSGSVRAKIWLHQLFNLKTTVFTTWKLALPGNSDWVIYIRHSHLAAALQCLKVSVLM